jgi:hypothetical protein
MIAVQTEAVPQARCESEPIVSRLIGHAVFRLAHDALNTSPKRRR